ncbi:MAG: crotonobetainyl-CoA:carnitine CoA-transferase CaiB-like acyl-CoA transferase [Candidatus Poriferisodalaceae bacterium]|jgi:crotonobetainyl-CoA:carnitine CoA-transferase CaiB-like acyl-CoA transferase
MHPQGPLAGIRVLDAAGMIAGPSAAAIMADLGADVIKLEPPQGDLLRTMAVIPGTPAPWWQLDNRGKRAIAVDLNTDAGVKVVHDLTKTCDIFLTNLTRERQERYRVTAEELRADQPELIYANLTGYGPTGPDRDRLGFDMTAFFGRGGVLNIMGEPGGTPPSPRSGQGDHTTALAVLSSILLALRERDLTGEGQVVDIALLQIATWTLGADISIGLATGEPPIPAMRFEAPSPLVSRFKAADGRWISFTNPGPQHWVPWCEVLDHPEWINDERFATPELRLENGPELMFLCDEVFATRTIAEWGPLLDAAHLTWGPIQTLDEVINDPQVEALGIFGNVDGFDQPYRTLNTPFHMESRTDIRGRAPEHGEHNGEILAEIGYDETEIDRLTLNGTVVSRGSTS